MSTLDEVRTLRGTALRLLPGFWQVRAQLDLAIEVLEYFAREAEHELTTGKFTTRPPIEPRPAEHIGVLQSMISAFHATASATGLMRPRTVPGQRYPGMGLIWA